jgi:hypothetical protein
MDTKVHVLVKSDLSFQSSEAIYNTAEQAFEAAVYAAAASDTPLPCQRKQDVDYLFRAS